MSEIAVENWKCAQKPGALRVGRAVARFECGCSFANANVLLQYARGRLAYHLDGHGSGKLRDFTCSLEGIGEVVCRDCDYDEDCALGDGQEGNSIVAGELVGHVLGMWPVRKDCPYSVSGKECDQRDLPIRCIHIDCPAGLDGVGRIGEVRQLRGC
jgi:hypothetical protein